MTAVSLGLRYRTARHLTMKQWGWRAYCRGQFAIMERWPLAARQRFERAMANIQRPHGMAPGLVAAAQHVIQLQTVLYGKFLDGIALGSFTLLNRCIDFGSLAQVEWRRELGERNNCLWRMNLAYMGYLVPLCAKDAHTGLEITTTLLTSMHEQNPWSARGIFRDVWHPYTVSHRVINLLTCLHLAVKAGVPEGSSDLNKIVDEIRLGSAFIAGNLERDLQYNHLFKNYVSLAMLAAAVGDSQLPIGMLQSIRDLITQQFLDDGGLAERSPMYHNLALLDLRILRDLGVMSPPLQRILTKSIDDAEAAANAMMHPDGDVSLFNDSWLGEAPRTADLLKKPIVSPSAPTRMELSRTGYIRLAKGGDSVIMDFGPCGPDNNPGHAHADFLSLELSISGERAIVDTGVPTYSAGKDRDCSRSAHAHNGPVLQGLEPIEFWESFRVGRRGYAHKLILDSSGNEFMSFAAWHDGYLHKGALVGRAILFVAEAGLLVADLWIGQQLRTANTHFTVSHKWTHAEGALFSSGNERLPQELVFKPIEGKISDISTTNYCERFGVWRQGTRVSLVPELCDGVRMMACWIRWGADDHPYQEDWCQLRQKFLAAMLALPATRSCNN